ncbi:MAG: YhbY family RNA-binding protein [Burkholderiales bacterium]
MTQAKPPTQPQLPLDSSTRRALRAAAHVLSPVIMMGKTGLTEPVAAEIDRALTRHGLLKIRVLSEERERRDALMAEVCERVGAGAVQHIGKILVIYRPKPPELESASVGQATHPVPKKRAKPVAGPKRVLGSAKRKSTRALPPRRQM